jgi:general secretion pathway protein E
MAIEETHSRSLDTAPLAPKTVFQNEPLSLSGQLDTPTDGFPKVSFEELVAGQPCLDRFSAQFLRNAGIYVYEDAIAEVHVALSDLKQIALLDTVAWTLQRRVRPEIALAEDIASLLGRLDNVEASATAANSQIAMPGRSDDDDTVESLRDLASGAPVVRAVNEIVEIALLRRATDIHLEPVREGMRVRIRVDGILMTVRTFTAELVRPIVSRIKILASLNIAERRLPQDGRTRIRVGNLEADVRVATMPTAHGEAAILRLLQREKGITAFNKIGLSTRDFGAFSQALKSPHGMIVVTGPTGSGKTTTLAAALDSINDDTRKILTIEDPIEYEINGVNQSQVKAAIGMTFANALRAFLRQDPDVIMVGEMRDTETARIAIQASLTGHLVMTTLHTNTAAAAITRLIDLQIEPFLLSATLQCIVAQRLVRVLCPHCRQRLEIDEALIRRESRYKALAVESGKVWKAVGCDRCGRTGYAGRRAVFEVLSVNDEIRHMITRGAPEADIETCAKAHGMTTLNEDGMRAVLAGETSWDEVLRVTASR